MYCQPTRIITRKIAPQFMKSLVATSVTSHYTLFESSALNLYNVQHFPMTALLLLLNEHCQEMQQVCINSGCSCAKSIPPESHFTVPTLSASVIPSTCDLPYHIAGVVSKWCVLFRCILLLLASNHHKFIAEDNMHCYKAVFTFTYPTNEASLFLFLLLPQHPYLLLMPL